MTPSSKDPRVYVEDILSAIERIRQYTMDGKVTFLSNGLLQDGVIRQLSVIGEAAAKLPQRLKTQHPQIPWKKIVGMRNVIVHEYSEVNIERIWETVEHDVPVLQRTIETMRDTIRHSDAA
jgi:uncharacterized protein with HEPN domain